MSRGAALHCVVGIMAGNPLIFGFETGEELDEEGAGAKLVADQRGSEAILAIECGGEIGAPVEESPLIVIAPQAPDRSDAPASRSYSLRALMCRPGGGSGLHLLVDAGFEPPIVAARLGRLAARVLHGPWQPIPGERDVFAHAFLEIETAPHHHLLLGRGAGEVRANRFRVIDRQHSGVCKRQAQHEC
jgi:hypothetical protein